MAAGLRRLAVALVGVLSVSRRLAVAWLRMLRRLAVALLMLRGLTVALRMLRWLTVAWGGLPLVGLAIALRRSTLVGMAVALAWAAVATVVLRTSTVAGPLSWRGIALIAVRRARRFAVARSAWRLTVRGRLATILLLVVPAPGLIRAVGVGRLTVLLTRPIRRRHDGAGRDGLGRGHHAARRLAVLRRWHDGAGRDGLRRGHHAAHVPVVAGHDSTGRDGLRGRHHRRALARHTVAVRTTWATWLRLTVLWDVTVVAVVRLRRRLWLRSRQGGLSLSSLARFEAVVVTAFVAGQHVVFEVRKRVDKVSQVRLGQMAAFDVARDRS